MRSHRFTDDDVDADRSGAPGAPGKRAMTDRLPGTARAAASGPPPVLPPLPSPLASPFGVEELHGPPS